MLSSPGRVTTHSRMSTPCRIVDNLERPPNAMFAELRTITCVTGSPPIRPETMLPSPCALSSRLVGVMRLCGSRRSVASTQSSVSMLAMTASTSAMT